MDDADDNRAMAETEPGADKPPVPARILVGLIRFYQQAVSPYLGSGSCRFDPTCSQYAVEAVAKYGLLKGSILGVWRILRCNPWGGFGYDPPRWFGEATGENK